MSRCRDTGSAFSAQFRRSADLGAVPGVRVVPVAVVGVEAVHVRAELLHVHAVAPLVRVRAVLAPPAAGVAGVGQVALPGRRVVRDLACQVHVDALDGLCRSGDSQGRTDQRDAQGTGTDQLPHSVHLVLHPNR